MKVVFLGLSITSSWGNGHATNYRGLVRELASRGHEVLFCERDIPLYENSRDLRELRGAGLCLYASVDELAQVAGNDIAEADLVIIGSHVPEGVVVAEYVLSITQGHTAFYDIETPMTIAKLAAGDHEYLTPALIPRFDLYLSSTGGPTLTTLENDYGARRAIAFYGLVDPRGYLAVASRPCWDLGYIGSYSEDRRPGLQSLLLSPARALRARRFVVAGPQYPESIDLARQRRPHPARRTGPPRCLLRRSAVHAQPHPRRDEAGGLVAQRAPLRSGRIRDRHHLRRLARARGVLHAREGDHRCAVGRRRAARADRDRRRGSPRASRQGTPTRAARAHSGASHRSAQAELHELSPMGARRGKDFVGVDVAVEPQCRGAQLVRRPCRRSDSGRVRAAAPRR